MKKDTQLITYALKKLARREQSEQELRVALTTKADLLDPSATTTERHNQVEQLLAECKQQNWQSDERFAHAMARHYTSQKKGIYAILHHLSAHNISAHIQNDIAKNYDYEQEVLIARALLHKKHTGRTPDAKTLARTLRFLQQRGFSRNTIAIIRKEMFSDVRGR